jgi:hypothetical protein
MIEDFRMLYFTLPNLRLTFQVLNKNIFFLPQRPLKAAEKKNGIRRRRFISPLRTAAPVVTFSFSCIDNRQKKI